MRKSMFMTAMFCLLAVSNSTLIITTVLASNITANKQDHNTKGSFLEGAHAPEMEGQNKKPFQPEA